ncbi:MAG: flagellar biosynthetic protein FliO, partial [Variibacter sp.]|nr:flagellar biosynthetic protein FliO [Variibacter sp.]
MIDSLLGVELPLPVKLILAFVIVLALIALAAWLFRRFAGDRAMPAAARGRQPRIAVIDAASVDGRRRLVLIRRDNVEHLLMIGGPTDIVIEQNIVRAVPVAQPAARPQAEAAARPQA